jgi:hypothetical protein
LRLVKALSIRRILPDDLQKIKLKSWKSVCLSVQIGETLEGLSPLERLLRCEVPMAHEVIADKLWESTSDAEVVQQLNALASSQLTEWESLATADSINDTRSALEERAGG